MSPPVPLGKRSGGGSYAEDILAEGDNSPVVVVGRIRRIRRMTVGEVGADSSCCSCLAEEADNTNQGTPFGPYRSNQMMMRRSERGGGDVFR
jgi:hypothetical protein